MVGQLCAPICSYDYKNYGIRFMVFFVLLLKLLSSMILAMEIVWFIGFWCYGVSFAIYLSSFMKEDSLEDDMKNLLLVFRLKKACWFLV